MRLYQLCQDIPARSATLRDEKSRGGTPIRPVSQDVTFKKPISRANSITDKIRKFESEEELTRHRSLDRIHRYSITEDTVAAAIRKYSTELSSSNDERKTSGSSTVPSDSSGRPLFGLAALRAPSPATPVSKAEGFSLGHGLGPTDSSGKLLFGLAALRACKTTDQSNKSEPSSPTTDVPYTRKCSKPDPQSPTTDVPYTRKWSKPEPQSPTEDVSYTRRCNKLEERSSASRKWSKTDKLPFTINRSHSSSGDSFLSNRTPVRSVGDAVSRMKGEETATSEKASEEQEARSLLNKFLGSQVLLQGIDPLMAHNKMTSTAATGMDSVDEVKGIDINKKTDLNELQQLLEQCELYEDRKKIRARMRAIAKPKDRSDSGPSHTAADVKLVRDWMSNNFPDNNKGEETKGKMADEAGAVSVTTKKSTTTSTTSSAKKFSNDPKSLSKVSPFDKFKQMDAQVAAKSAPKGGPMFKFTQPGLTRSATDVKDMLLYWCQCRTRSYKNVNIENFSGSWSDGLAFCALIHHFYPDAFDYDSLSPSNRRHNFELAFKVAEEKAGIFPLLDVEDMVKMKRPDWKCVFTYVQSIYRRLKDC